MGDGAKCTPGIPLLERIHRACPTRSLTSIDGIDLADLPSRENYFATLSIFSCCSREGPVDEHSYDEQCREPQRYANCHRFPGPVRSKIAAPGGRDHRRFEPGSDDRLDDADAAGSDPGTDPVRPRTSSAGVSWVTTATLLSAAVFTPLLGRYGDQHGKKRTLVGVLVVMVIGSIVAALAHNPAAADPRPCTPGNSHRDLPSRTLGLARRDPTAEASRRHGPGQRNSRVRQRSRPRRHRSAHIGSGCRLPQRLLDGHRIRSAGPDCRRHAGPAPPAQKRRPHRPPRCAESGRRTPSAPAADFSGPPMGVVVAGLTVGVFVGARS